MAHWAPDAQALMAVPKLTSVGLSWKERKMRASTCSATCHFPAFSQELITEFSVISLGFVVRAAIASRRQKAICHCAHFWQAATAALKQTTLGAVPSEGTDYMS